MPDQPRLVRLVRLVLAVALLGVGILRLAPPAEPAGAAVGHVLGFQAVVDGFRSWYGSYDLGGHGTAWCIDHGIRAPDPDLGYQPTDLADVPAGTRAALAWTFGRHGTAPDPVGAAALMLVAHDLMDASYPSGPLDVDALGSDALVGFGPAGADVLERARAIKADALAHSHLRPPWLLAVEVGEPMPGHAAATVARLTAAGVPVGGVEVSLRAEGVTLTTPAVAVTGADGGATFGFIAAAGPYRLIAETVVPDLVLQAFAPTLRPAQRVARPATLTVSGTADRVGVIPPGRLVIRKVGDAEPRLPVTGARFEIRSTDEGDEPAEIIRRREQVGPSGTIGPISLPPGRYEVRELEPPPGYDRAGPWLIDVPTGEQVELVAANTATPTTTTSTSSSTTTSTTSTSTTSTSTSTTTSTTTTLAAAPPSTSSPPPPTAAEVPPPAPPPAPRTLPRTGADPGALTALGSGLVLLGGSLRRRPERRRDVTRT